MTTYSVAALIEIDGYKVTHVLQTGSPLLHSPFHLSKFVFFNSSPATDPERIADSSPIKHIIFLFASQIHSVEPFSFGLSIHCCCPQTESGAN